MIQNNYLEAFREFVQEIVREAVDGLRTEITLVKKLQTDWVNQKEAMRITGIKCPSTMKAERERKKTLFVVKYEGNLRKMPKYERASLLAYNESKIKDRVVGRVLQPLPR